MSGLPVVELSDLWAVVVSSAAWVLLSLIIGYATHRVSLERLDHDTRLTRLRSFEADGRFYERRLRIRRWKPWLPEAGDLFEGGFDKSHLRGRTDAHLARFAAETRRAEITHWALLACGPLFFVWCPPLLGLVMVAFAAAMNLPPIAAQRYNRARLDRLMARRRARRTPVST